MKIELSHCSLMVLKGKQQGLEDQEIAGLTKRQVQYEREKILEAFSVRTIEEAIRMAEELEILERNTTKYPWETLDEIEKTVAELAGRGASNEEIARVTFTSPSYVGNVLSRVFKKLGIPNRVALASITNVPK